MSAATATRVTAAPATPAVSPVAPGAPRTAAAPRARLRVVRPPAQARTRAPFVALCMTVLVASLLGTLLLNTTMAQGEYERLGLQSRLAQSAQAQQELLGRLDHVSSPAQIAAAATSLGMVPSTGGGYLRLADGTVLGAPVPPGAGG